MTIYVSFSFIFSPAFSYSYGTFKIFNFIVICIGPALLMIIYGEIKSFEYAFIAKFTVYLGLIISTALILLFIEGGFTEMNNNFFSRYSLGNINTIWLARFLSLSLILLHSTDLVKKSFFLYSSSLLIIISSLLTGSKIILYITIPLLVLYKARNFQFSKNAIRIFLLVGSIFLISVIFLNSFNVEAITRRFGFESNTIQIRLNLIFQTLSSYSNESLFKQIFGSGFATIAQSFGYNIERFYPHNIIAEMLYELGILGTIIFILQPIHVFYLYFKNKHNIFVYLYFLFLLFSLTSGDLVGNNYLFLFYGLVIISSRKKLVDGKLAPLTLLNKYQRKAIATMDGFDL